MIDQELHGTMQGYWAGCRMPCCKAANASSVRKWEHSRRTSPLPEKVPADEVRRHVLYLLHPPPPALPMTKAQIGAKAGVNPMTVQRLVRHKNPTTEMEAGRAAQLLAVALDPAAVDPNGSRRRLGGMFWMGRSMRRISRETGISLNFLLRTLNGLTEEVPRDIHDQIAAYYERNMLIVGCNSQRELSRRRQIAMEREFYPPGAWGNNIDDPKAEPDPHVLWYVDPSA